MIALSSFFALGAAIASVTGIALLLPDRGVEVLWWINPQAHVAFLSMGFWALPLMFVVAGACAVCAVGLWIRARWGHRLALVLLVANLIGDVTNALLRGDLRTLIGLPIAGGLVAYLLSAKVRGRFGT